MFVGSKVLLLSFESTLSILSNKYFRKPLNLLDNYNFIPRTYFMSLMRKLMFLKYTASQNWHWITQTIRVWIEWPGACYFRCVNVGFSNIPQDCVVIRMIYWRDFRRYCLLRRLTRRAKYTDVLYKKKRAVAQNVCLRKFVNLFCYWNFRRVFK